MNDGQPTERVLRDYFLRPEVRKSIRGPEWITGSGAPASDLGNNGDFYLDTATKTVYVKQAGAWV